MIFFASPSADEFKGQFATNWLYEYVPHIEIQIKKLLFDKKKKEKPTRNQTKKTGHCYGHLIVFILRTQINSVNDILI